MSRLATPQLPRIMAQWLKGLEFLSHQCVRRLGQERVDRTSVSLLEQLRRPGDNAAWNCFVKLYTPYLHGCLRGLGVQDCDQADLLQEVFLILHQKLPDFRYDRSKSFHAWLRTILLNKWRDACRRKSGAIAGDEALAWQPGPNDLAAVDEEEHRAYIVRRAMQLMQSDFQPATWQACWESVVGGRPAGEIAQQLGLTVEAVYAANYRVLRRLRQELDGLLS